MAAAAELAIRDSEFTGTIGVARADITPPAGIFARSWGSSKHDIAPGAVNSVSSSLLVFVRRIGIQ